MCYINCGSSRQNTRIVGLAKHSLVINAELQREICAASLAWQ